MTTINSKKLNNLSMDEFTVIGSFVSSWSDLWSLTFTSVDLKKYLMDQQNDELWKYFLKAYFPYIDLPEKDFYKKFLETYKAWYKTISQVKQDPFFLMYLNCSENDPLGVFRDDKEIIMAGIEKKPALYRNFSRKFKEDDELILCALKMDRFIIHDVPKNIRHNFQEIADIKDDNSRAKICDELIVKLSSQRISTIKSFELFKTHLKPIEPTRKNNTLHNDTQEQISTRFKSASLTRTSSQINLGLFKDSQATNLDDKSSDNEQDALTTRKYYSPS
ncbi:Dot/Icm secretion system substrate [Legionella sainthelensi]|uniref:Dot/Icm secretion system substrate n=1 Tax=Legionella sainthelensi TaxID=28087 RepID=A0A0W0YPI0_9GAMM|nr:DUF4116 domain-containing protein [Legionella sainthelensi]KTD58747.1 Dot/Icm secretion system substrate [Legionella sainthelensi]VEH34669.1 Dot/Icm secretion system substrate [Legionella sainthelensi]